jgi:hypothetical protein
MDIVACSHRHVVVLLKMVRQEDRGTYGDGVGVGGRDD